mgnify:CR=1 FL=1
MRICVLGAGAIGCYLAARLIRSGRHPVAMLARGDALAAIARDGVRLESGDGRFSGRPCAVSSDPAALGAQDLVFVTTKAHAHAATAETVARLLGPEGTAVYVCNGIPWWWAYGAAAAATHGSCEPGQADQALWNRVRPERVLGCVVYCANEIIAPGVVRHTANDCWLIGEPDGSDSPRLRRVVAALGDGGLGAQASTNLRREIWAKLLRNGPMNTLCALTRLPVDGLAGDPGLLAQVHALVDEIAAVAAAHGSDVSPWVAAARNAPAQGGAVHAGSAPAARIRPSMLQDVEAGRRLEVDAIVGRVQSLARSRGVATPVLDLLLPLLRGLDRSLC